MRLDGSVEPEKRFEIVKAFNSDPTIDALLLTTHGRISFTFAITKNVNYFFDLNLVLLLAVGGLGLNLTSADTLVFMEHDWNPMRDHQVGLQTVGPYYGLYPIHFKIFDCAQT